MCASIKVQHLTPSKKKASITSARITFPCLIQVHRKSKQVTVIQRETNIGQLVTFNAVSDRRRREEILKNNLLGKQPLRIGIIRALNECTAFLRMSFICFFFFFLLEAFPVELPSYSYCCYNIKRVASRVTAT